MSRSGYSEDCDHIAMWRGQVASAIRGRRGQALLRDLLLALDAMPVKRLIAEDLQNADGEVCALGAVGARRGIKLSALDPEDHDTVAGAFDIAHQLAREITWINDEAGWRHESPEERWRRVRDWAERNLNSETAPALQR